MTWMSPFNPLAIRAYGKLHNLGLIKLQNIKGKKAITAPTNNPSRMPIVKDIIIIVSHFRPAISLIINTPIIPPIPPDMPPIKTLSMLRGSILTRWIVEVAIIATTVAPIRLPKSESNCSLGLDTLLACSVVVTLGIVFVSLN